MYSQGANGGLREFASSLLYQCHQLPHVIAPKSHDLQMQPSQHKRGFRVRLTASIADGLLLEGSVMRVPAATKRLSAKDGQEISAVWASLHQQFGR